MPDPSVVSPSSSASPTKPVLMVVGGTSGIGLATAELAVSRGWRVAVVARDPDRVRRVAEQLTTTPGLSLGVPADVVDADQVAQAVTAVIDHFGRLDAVVTTAQAMVYGRVEDLPAEALRRMTDVAVLGTAHLAQTVLPRFRDQGGGSLVVVGSLLSQIAVPAMGAYCSAKAAQHTLVRTLQQEVRGQRGVHVSLVLPGAVDTPIYGQSATYAGSRGSAPPPVASAEHLAGICLDTVTRPRRIKQAGPGNRVAIAGFRYLPGVYDRLAPRLVNAVVLRGPEVGPDQGNLFDAVPDAEAVSGGWTRGGRLRRQGGRARWRRG